MRSGDVLEVLHLLDRARVRYWVDGGWGVDALLGEESRPHSDLDLVVAVEEAGRAQEALRTLGFAHAPDVSPGLPARIVLRGGPDRQVDLHVVRLDPIGNGWQELDGGAWGMYPANGLTEDGVIAGKRVPCITPELQLRHHLGYSWDADDIGDMERLATRFGLPLPPRTSNRRVARGHLMNRTQGYTMDEAAIRTLIEDWAHAVRTRNVDGILRNHSADIVMFDVPPPLQSKGIEAYRRTWETFFTWSRNPTVFDIKEMNVTAGADVAFVTALMRCAGTEASGVDIELDFRLTIGLRKIDNQWTITHEHHSIPATQ